MKTEIETAGWKVSRVPIESRGGSNTAFKIGPFEACIYDDWRQRDRGLSEADIVSAANLIAAAPELLQACKFALQQLEGSKPKSGVHASSLLADIEIVKSAIAKAEGKEGV
jgi:hypothetical protein